MSQKIDSATDLLQQKIQQFETAKSALPATALLYKELQEEYDALRSEAVELCDLYIGVITQMITLLGKKKSDMINKEYANEFEMLVNQLAFDFKVFKKLQKIIEKHNEKTNDFQNSIKMAQERIESHMMTEFSDEITEAETAIETKEKELNGATEERDKLHNEIYILEQEVRNSQIPADSINADIKFILGRSDIIFVNTSMGYQVTRNGKLAKNLSKGEENAIALIYFFNSLLDSAVDVKNTIVVLDDPISSFDTNFYYNAISYIREKTSLAGQTFIFTHKFSLFKDYSRMYTRDTNRYIIRRVNGQPLISNEDKSISQYHDEYAYLFKKIYTFVKEPPKDTAEYLQYPNMARRLLEGFLTFKLPSPESEMTMMDKVQELERGKETEAGRAVLRLLNNQSHFRFIPDSDRADDIDSLAALPDILKNLLTFMRVHDTTHYDALAKLADSDFVSDGEVVRTITPSTRIIKLYEMPASAGLGEFLDESPFEKIEVTNPKCTFAVRISGDSMEPDIPDKSIVLVKQCDDIPNATIGIVWYDGESYCKKIVHSKTGTLLVSLNKNYPPISVTSESYKIFGEVVETIRPHDAILA